MTLPQPKPKVAQAQRTRKLPWKKILRRVCSSLVLVLVLGGLIWLYQVTKPSKAPINHIKIIATFNHLQRQTLQQAIVPYLKNGFYYLNVFGLKHQLLNIPWVYAVAIQRELPDTIIVTIVEQTPVARWGDKALFNAEGVMFYPDFATFPLDIPLLLGPAYQAATVFQQYYVMGQILLPLNVAITQLMLSPQHFWHLVLNSGMEIFLNEATATAQLKLLLNLYPKIMTGHVKPPLTIDMRYNNGIAVKWSEVLINNEELKIKNEKLK